MRYRRLAIPLFCLFLFLLIAYLIQFGVVEKNPLINTRWEIEHFVVDGTATTDFVGGQWIHFEKDRFYGFDNCNEISGRYKTFMNGGFTFPIFGHTLQACWIINSETGERSSMGDIEFNDALRSVVEFEIKNGRLWLYYSEDKKNVLILLPKPIPS
jgi:heat shock protein HslJ